jgi:hypothetical protein
VNAIYVSNIEGWLVLTYKYKAIHIDRLNAFFSSLEGLPLNESALLVSSNPGGSFTLVLPFKEYLKLKIDKQEDELPMDYKIWLTFVARHVIGLLQSSEDPLEERLEKIVGCVMSGTFHLEEASEKKSEALKRIIEYIRKNQDSLQEFISYWSGENDFESRLLYYLFKHVGLDQQNENGGKDIEGTKSLARAL